VALRSSVPRQATSRERSAVPNGLVVAVVVALVAGLVGVMFLGLMLRGRNAVAGSVSAGGLTLQVQSAQWVDLEHDHDDGFQMPQSMTPGAPGPDQQRLAVEVAVSNRGSGETLFSEDEFSIQRLDGQAWPLVADNLSEKHLSPGFGVTGSLSFDLPAASASQASKGLFLVWSRAGKVLRVPVTVGGTATHVHG
jgi:Domain of unknown function (DUF4352)